MLAFSPGRYAPALVIGSWGSRCHTCPLPWLPPHHPDSRKPVYLITSVCFFSYLLRWEKGYIKKITSFPTFNIWYLKLRSWRCCPMFSPSCGGLVCPEVLRLGKHEHLDVRFHSTIVLPAKCIKSFKNPWTEVSTNILKIFKAYLSPKITFEIQNIYLPIHFLSWMSLKPVPP